MKIASLLLLATAAAFVVPAHARIERTVEKTFSVNDSGLIRLRTGGGGITVQNGPDGVVKVVAKQRIRASSEAEADDLLRNLDLKIVQEGNTVTASAKYERTGSWFKGTPVSVEFVATVPASFSAEAETSGGGITMGDLGGHVKADTSGGGIRLGRIGGRVDAETSGGGITLAQAGGETRLNTSGGSINVGRVTAPADLDTSGGGITVDAVEQRLRADTSGGSIRARIVGPLAGNCDLSTSGGGITLTVDKSAAFDLDASSSGGGVEADGLMITLNGGTKRNSLKGAVNGGGPTVKLHTSGGSVRIRAE